MDHYPGTGLDEDGGVCLRVRTVVERHCCGMETAHYHCGITTTAPRLGRRHSPILSNVLERKATGHSPARIRVLVDSYLKQRRIL